MKTPYDKRPERKNVAEDVVASREARPMRMICNTFAVALLPHKLNTDECAEIDPMKATSADKSEFSFMLKLS
jgi:hypothetical protein